MESATGPLRRCGRSDLGVSVEILGGYANIVVRNIGPSACRLWPMPVGRTVTGRAGRAFHIGRSAHEAMEAGLWGDFPAGAEWDSGGTTECPDRIRGPFHMVATVGPYTARASSLSAVEVGCPSRAR
jgi:hypothetical protein